MKKIKGAIFDMDGTLLNSMDYWATVAEEFLVKNNLLSKVGDNRRFLEWGMKEFYSYAVKELGLTLTYEETHKQMYDIMEYYYENDIGIKNGVKNMLDTFLENGVKMCLATATDRFVVDKILKRLRLDKYFSKIFTVKEVGVGKSQPVIYEKALEFLGTTKNDTYVFEDAYYAIKTAHDAGFLVAGVEDKNVFVPQDEILPLCNLFLSEKTGYDISSII
ncbi:MAG: HAD family phosphatase [Clostridia bacterium]|nr:HAD family phosphatase [Clostridia bacterium]